MSNQICVDGFELQREPLICVVAIPGDWLLPHTATSWRKEDPSRGFQRIVNERRARAIAIDVLDQRRTFPNAIILATEKRALDRRPDGKYVLPDSIRFLVIDGQHRLWAQTYSEYVPMYACMIHFNLSRQQMAKLFVEINDTQKRVPSSLRWDLVRLIRPQHDPEGVAASEIVSLLATDSETRSALFQRIDLTSEHPSIKLKSASVTPDIKRLIGKKGALRKLSFEQQYGVILTYVQSIRDLDADAWQTGESVFYKARVFRALLRLLGDIAQDIDDENRLVRATVTVFLKYLRRIDPSSLQDSQIRQSQGNAGIKAIYEEIRKQVFNMGESQQ